MSRVDINTKDFFSQLDDDTIKSAKKKDKKDKKSKKVNKNNPFGYDFDPTYFKQKKNKDKKDKKKLCDENPKKKNKDKEKKHKKSDKDEDKTIGNSKISKKVLKGIKSHELREQFRKQKVLIDNKKFWSKD